MSFKNEFILFSGSSHEPLAKEVSEILQRPLGALERNKFPDGEIGVRVLENVRGRDVFVMQTIAKDPNFYLMEILILCDALKRASVKSITAIIPYFGYCRQDRKSEGREPITARLIANLLETAGIDHLLTMDLHAGQIEGFFNVPVDNLHAQPSLIKEIKQDKRDNLVVIAPDVGSIKIARSFAANLHTAFGVINKKRIDPQHVDTQLLIGNVENKNVLLVDDMCSTGATLKHAVEICKAHGAKHIYAAFTHLIKPLSPELEQLVDHFYIGNTTPFTSNSSKVTTVSVAQIIAKAIHSVVYADSISSIFKT